MNLTEILEGNKLIAEFMGGIIVDKIFICNEKTKSHNERCLHHYNISQAKYHSSWDWLMPCIDKIEHLYEDKHKLPFFEITSHNCNFALIHPMKFKQWVVGCFPESPEKIKANSKIEAAWMVAVEFIKYYNKQNNK